MPEAVFPRITLILLTYNQRAYLKEAVSACLSQIGEPIEILLSDDASTDGSFELMKQLADQYSGPHLVRLRRNTCNLGIGEHYNQAIADSGGQLLVTAAGDDISLPGRVQTLAKAWDETGQKADLIASHLIDMSLEGQDLGIIHAANLAKWPSPDAWVRKRPYVVGASHAFTKRLHTHFGLFSPDLAYEDQVMALRACGLGGGVTVNEPLVRYRRGGISQRKNDALTPQGFLQWSLKKHTRQRALYSQIRQDLQTLGRSDLWRGKVRRHLDRSTLALRLMSASGLRQKLALGLQPNGAGMVWSLRTVLYLTLPALGARIQAWQQHLKRQ